jgi:hypothetical protein
MGLLKVAHSTQVAEAVRGEAPARLPRHDLVLLAVVAAIVIAGVTYIIAGTSGPASGALTSVDLHMPGSPASVLSGTPATTSAGLARRLFTSAPVVIVAASGASSGTLQGAAREARKEFAPLLLTPAGHLSGTALPTHALRVEISALHPEDVLAVGIPGRALAGDLPGIRVVTTESALPAISRLAPLRHVALLVAAGGHGAAMTAAIATARAAGVPVIPVRGDDPRADSAAITTLARSKPQQIVALGAGFGTAKGLAAKVTVAETGVQLPGGGQILFPGHRLVCLYGSPGTPALGALGQQDLPASIARIRAMAATYKHLSRVPTVPAFEILATVAQGSAGRNGLYSYQNSVATLRPWVRTATKDGFYVILDLQPGRASLLSQAKLYRPLLKNPDVGLALDPEWKLQPGQLPLRQIGGVSVTDVNSVVRWLAALTATYHLPQKLLVLHQFQLSMIRGEAQLDTHHSDLAIVIHMDGQGAPTIKRQTWNAVVAAAPHGVFFGWKNFFVKDHPMLDPAETMRQKPQPVMISYQ